LGKKYSSSIKLFKKIIKKDANNLEAIEGLADVLSWNDNFKESLKYYNKILNLNYSKNVALKKARMFGWKGDYAKAIETYKKIYEKTKDKKILLEKTAKKAWWNKRLNKAIKTYKKLLTLNPKNVEARSDLSQIQANKKIWYSAKLNFKNIVKNYKWHKIAKESHKKAEIVSKKALYEIGGSWFKSESVDRATSENIVSSYINLSKPLNYYYTFNTGFNYSNIYYKNTGSINSYTPSLGLSLNKFPEINIAAKYIYSYYSLVNQGSHKFDISFGTSYIDGTDIIVNLRKNDLRNNDTVFLSKLKDYSAEVLINNSINRYFNINIFYINNILTDKNTANTIGIHPRFTLNYFPSEIVFQTGFEYSDWAYNKYPDYFSPNNFWTIPIWFILRHHFNKGPIHFGSNNTIVDLRYGAKLDLGKTILNIIQFSLKHDFTKTFAIKINFNTIQSSVYDDYNSSLNFIGYF
jgi:tetratricopeptide (TPR) repeat protein